MTRPMPLSDFVRLPPALTARVVDGLSSAIDAVAERADERHRFLRYQWFAAALAAYGGAARTLVVSDDDRPLLALPMVARGPAPMRIAAIPGSYWPYRSFPLSIEGGPDVLDVALASLAQAVNGLRIGPVYDDDASAMPLIAAARARGWTVLDRYVARSWAFDIAATEGAWPRGSTLRKNRFHEKHLAAHGHLDWRFVDAAEWPAGFAALGTVEEKSWIASDTDGSDAKFTAAGHLAFWEAAAADPVLAAMFHAALLRIDGVPAAFSFDIDTGAVKYAIANSYDPAFAKHSPGKLLYYRNLVEGRARGVSLVDWGAGDSGYKQVIGASEGPAIRDWLLLRPGVPGVMGRMLRGVWRQSGNPVLP